MITTRAVTKNDIQRIWQLRTSAILVGCASHYTKFECETWASSSMPETFTEILLSLGGIVAIETLDSSNGEQGAECLGKSVSGTQAETQERVLGFGFVDAAQCRLEAVFVDAEAVGMGIGKLLAAKLEVQAKKAGVKTLSLSSSLNAAGFYQNLGYIAGDETQWRHPSGIDLMCIPMTKSL
ncbi:Acetyltransferase (GNAT) domain [Shewanella psychrophila]|uniref:Acetyltransferase (GNAT) domain n=1 Tax=Shewanella psychrophila TaxID=225848 RepID=A0A1S6HNS9_9GAMM|nr:GNAT family N-acetyltransferase [Shewanella psychrophila]AQS37162.1 Acetyltransferase (GNAT) domain [Shewanella psychrophila]